MKRQIDEGIRRFDATGETEVTAMTDADAAWLKPILELSPCSDAIDWLRTQPDPDTAWATCERGDWMLWYLIMTGVVAPQRLVRMTCSCARLALPYTTDSCVGHTIETVEARTRGEGSIADVRAAADAATAAAADADDAGDVAATAAADAAAAAADAAAAGDVADYAADAAYAAFAAAAAAAAAAADAAADVAAAEAADAAAEAARHATLKRCAEIVRAEVPTSLWPPRGGCWRK